MGIWEKFKGAFSTKYAGALMKSDRHVRPSWKIKDYLGAYETSAYVFSCVKIRGEKLGEIEFKLKDRKGKEVEVHQVLDLLNRPNPYQTKNEFFELYQTYKDLTGSVYIHLVRETDKAPVLAMYLLKPDLVTTCFSEDGLIVGYKYKGDKGTDIEFEPFQVISSHYPSPLHSIHEGLTPLKAGAFSVDTERQLSEYQYNVLKNGGKIDGIISFKTQQLTEKQVNEIRARFKERHAGAKNAGEPLIGFGDMDYKNIGLSPTELSYIESKKMTRDDILLLYRVPKALLAQGDGQQYDTKEAKTIFLSETIRPLMKNLVARLNWFVVPSDLELSYIDPVPEDVDLKIKKIESGSNHNWLTINEKRDIMGYEPVEGGDVILAPFGLQPFDGDPMLLDDATKGINKEIDDISKKLVKSSGKKKSKENKINHPLRDEKTRRKYFNNWIKKADKREAVFVRVFKGYLKAQMLRVLESVKDNKEGMKSLKKDFAGQHFDLENEIRLGADKLFPILLSYLQDSGQDAIDLVGTGEVFDSNAVIEEGMRERTEVFLRSVNETTFEKLIGEFQESYKESEDFKQLSKRLNGLYGDIGKKRAMTIARTEVAMASQTGTFSGYKQSGIGIKIWVAVLDSNTRDSHALVDGEEQPIDRPFSNGLMYPADPSGGPAEVINCRCTI